MQPDLSLFDPNRQRQDVAIGQRDGCTPRCDHQTRFFGASNFDARLASQPRRSALFTKVPHLLLLGAAW
jgi:hypothetical protein